MKCSECSRIVKPIVAGTWREELTWAAGFVDGEGYFASSNRRGAGIAFVITQANRPILERFHDAILGLGYLRGGKPPRPPRTKPTWKVEASSFHETQAIIVLLWEFLSEPKREQASAALRRHHSASKEVRRMSYKKYIREKAL